MKNFNRKYSLFFFCLLCFLFIVGCAAHHEFKKGEKFTQMNEWDSAVTHFQKACNQAPENFEYQANLKRAKVGASNSHYIKGESFLKVKKYDDAIIEFQLAIVYDPSHKNAMELIKHAKNLKDADDYYKSGLSLLEFKKEKLAIEAFNKSLKLNPENKDAKEKVSELEKKPQRAMGEYEITLKSTQPISLKLKDTNIRKVFEILSRLSGVNFVFDSDFRDKKTSIFIEDSTFNQVLDLILKTNKLFKKIVSDNTIIIVPRTKTKIKEYEDYMIRTFYLSNMEAKKAVSLLRTVLQTRSIYINEELNSIVLRDTPEKVKIAEKILDANDIPSAEMLLDVEVVEVSHSKMEDLGLQLSQYSISSGLGNWKSNTIYSEGLSSGDSLDNLLSYDELTELNTSLTYFSVPTATLNLLKQDSDSEMLANPQIRVKDNQKAKIHIGDRIPIRSNRRVEESGAVTYDFEYQDTGIKLNVQPKLNYPDEITLKITLEVSSLGPNVGTPLDPQYSIKTRTTETILQLNFGETVVIGGLIMEINSKSADKLAFLGELPWLSKFFTHKIDDKSKTDILMSITPYIVRNIKIPSPDSISIWSGTSDIYSSKEPYSSFKEEASSEIKKEIKKLAPDFEMQKEIPLKPNNFEERIRKE
jgi:general secretion pathway protein D